MLKSARKVPLRIFAALIVTVALAGCTVGPDFQKPEVSTASTYLAETPPVQTAAIPGPGGNPQRFTADGTLPAQWWSLFGSEPLDRLVRAALAESPTLAQAKARLVQAGEAFNAGAGTTFFPQVDAHLSVDRKQMNPAALGIANVPNPGPFTLYNASVSVSYALDLMGGNRRSLEGLAAKVEYRQFELEAARQTLAANVVNAAIRQAALRSQISRLRDLVAARSQQLTIIEARHKQGGIADLDLRNQSLLLEQTRAALPPLENQLTRVNNQLAAYLGREPAAAQIDRFELDSLHLPEELPLSLPSALARQRPDIRAAEALWHAAGANVGVATANLYPQVTLSASLGSQQTGPEDLVRDLNVWNLGGNLIQPIFRGGELRARKRSALAAYDEAAAVYRQTVLQGFREVADTLSALDADARTLKPRVEAANHARASYAIAQKQYEAGGISHLVLLDVQRQLLQTEFDSIQARADRYTDTAALLHALGGGWWNAAPESEAPR